MKEEFEKLRKEKNYYELGKFFWNGFLFATRKTRLQYQRLWNSLSKEEQLCVENAERK